MKLSSSNNRRAGNSAIGERDYSRGHRTGASGNRGKQRNSRDYRNGASRGQSREKGRVDKQSAAMAGTSQAYASIQSSYNYGRSLPKQQAMVGNFVSAAGPDGFSGYSGLAANQVPRHQQASGSSQGGHQGSLGSKKSR